MNDFKLISLKLIFPGILILPIFPRRWRIKEALEWCCGYVWDKPWFKSVLYDIIKGGGAIACFYGANHLRSFFNDTLADGRIIHASLTYVLFLLALDFLYDFEEVFEICDNSVLAGYGLMINAKQTIIVIAIGVVHTTCVILCVLKTFLRSNLRLFHIMIECEENEQDQLPTTNTATFDPHEAGSVV